MNKVMRRTLWLALLCCVTLALLTDAAPSRKSKRQNNRREPKDPKFGDGASRKNATISFEEQCMFPKLDWRPCTLPVPRYMYNHFDKRCKAIDYSGCEATGLNFFFTWNECSQTCKEDRAKTCRLPPDSGIEGEFYPGARWYHQKDQCYQFIFAGYGGNVNNFHSYESCMLFCEPDSKFSKGLESRKPYGRGDTHKNKHASKSTTSGPTPEEASKPRPTERPKTKVPVTSASSKLPTKTGSPDYT